MKKLLILIGLSMVLVGCKTIETVHTTTLITPPSTLMKECLAAEPPNQQAYLAASWSDKEGMLTTYANAQTLVLANCNIDKRSLQQWVTEQKALYETKAK